MTDELDKLRELERAAASEPWGVEHQRNVMEFRGYGVTSLSSNVLVDGMSAHEWCSNNARFIAAFRNCAKELLDVVEAAENMGTYRGEDVRQDFWDALDRLKAKVREVVK